ncbi:unnamed protein product [Rangifer tarandus platyrhynchus]|uniref:Uncharacterized protein n=2 Tax=Rangifer tarandus platyrhynchus TaxID=3082113 RepID=A0ABN8YFH1_RANTA|nr:unnamed protein product [Rangifer tarandus platyrhynchus]CAI9699675.1 unnamed protein product [Rangifer tarandus platyrhynchus]
MSSHSTKEKLIWAASGQQRRNREDPRNQWSRQLLGIPCPNLLLRPARLLTAFPAYRHVSSTNGENPGSQISRERGLTLAPKSDSEKEQPGSSQNDDEVLTSSWPPIHCAFQSRLGDTLNKQALAACLCPSQHLRWNWR